MLKLAFVIEAVDKATATVRKVNATIDRITEPVRRVRASFNSLLKESGFSRVTGALKELGERGRGVGDALRNVAGWMTVATAAAAGAFLGFKRVADQVDELTDTARMLGITTERLSAMGYAAQLNGSSQEEMGEALRFLSRNMVEAINGSKDAQQWFARVGIPLERLKKMDAPQVFEAIADKFNQVGDAGQNSEKKIALMQALLGRSGAKLKQVLDLGSAGLRGLYEEAERTGAVVGGSATEALGEFNDSWDRLRATLFGVLSNALSKVAPVLKDIVDRITDWASANKDLIATRVSAFIEVVSKRLPGFIEDVAKITAAVWAAFEAVNAIANALGGWENVFAILVGFIVGKALVALTSLATALWGVAAAFLATPFGLFVAGVAAVAGAAYLIYKYWDPIKHYFSELWEGVKIVFTETADWIVEQVMSLVRFVADNIVKLNNLMPDWVKNYTPNGMLLDAAAQAVQPLATPAASALDGVALQRNADVGGTLKIQIDQTGRARVTELMSNSPAMDYEVFTATGRQMVTP